MSGTTFLGKEILLQPIGFVETDAVGDEVREKSRLSRIVLRRDLQDALMGIEDFSHLFVLFWLSEISSDHREWLKVYPRGRRDLPLVGVFATRTKFRPNPIGLTLVKLIRVNGNVLVVRGLDAFDKTPILDIKPFDPWDTAAEAKVPVWWMKLQEERMAKRKERKTNTD